MAKFLRSLDFRGFQAVAADSEQHLLSYGAGWHPNFLNGVKLYVRYALPVPCAALIKLNVYACREGELAPREDGLGIGSVWVTADFDRIAKLDERGQQSGLLDIVHRGALRAAKYFGFPVESFHAAQKRVVAGDFRLEYWLGKPLSSPDRARKAQLFYRFNREPILSAVFFDRQGNELLRLPFARCNELNVGKISWIDDDTLKVPHQNGIDHWLCRTDGTFEFVYPRLESGNPHHVYALGVMLLEGHPVLPDRDRGLELLRQAAADGYHHAIQRLALLAAQGGPT